MQHATPSLPLASPGPAIAPADAIGAARARGAARRRRSPLVQVAQFVAFAGLFAAAILTAGHLLDLPVPCGASRGCAAVASHPASRLAGVPIAYFGFGGYLVILGLLGKAPRSRPARLGLVGVCGVGAILSGVLLYVSVNVIGATCPWCVASGAAMGMLLALSLIIAWRGSGGRLPWTARHDTGRGTLADPPAGAGHGLVRLHAGWFWSLAMVTSIAVGLQAGMMQREAGRPPIPAARLAAFASADLVDAGKSLGLGDAPVTVVIFADFFCPACRGAMEALVRFQRDNPAGVRLVYRHMPLWEDSVAIAALSEIAAETGRFWEFSEHVHGRSGRLGGDGYLRLMSDLGIEPAEAQRRIADPADVALARVADDIALAERLGVSATPTFIVFVKGQPPRSANQRTLPRLLNSPTTEHHLAQAAAHAPSDLR